MIKEKLIARYILWMFQETKEKQSDILYDMFKYVSYINNDDIENKEIDAMIEKAENLYNKIKYGLEGNYDPKEILNK